MRGLFVTLEGIDGSGKTTQLDRLKHTLIARGVETVITREPGGTPAGERIRDVMLSPASVGIVPEVELFLMCAARAQHVAEVISPALSAGRIVISDRYTDSSVAFQGYGRRLDLQVIEEMNRFATRGLEPDLTLLFDLDPQLARARISRESVGGLLGELDDADLSFHRRVREGYLELAERHPHRFRVIDSSGSVDETHALTLAHITAVNRQS